MHSSKLIEAAVNEVATLPGIGKKTALRLVLFLLKTRKEHTFRLTEALQKLRTEIQYCQQCYNVSDAALCGICQNEQRHAKLLCVVEDIQDVLAIENTAQYRGHYHVLGGIISPMEGIGPEQLSIHALVKRIKDSAIQEVIFALRATIEGDTTVLYITKKLQGLPIKLSTIARGVAIGSELEYTDEATLGRSITSRVAYQ